MAKKKESKAIDEAVNTGSSVSGQQKIAKVFRVSGEVTAAKALELQIWMLRTNINRKMTALGHSYPEASDLLNRAEELLKDEHTFDAINCLCSAMEKFYNTDTEYYLNFNSKKVRDSTTYEVEETARIKKSSAAKKAINARHDKPGGSRDKKTQIQKIWATGKYTSRDICAEQECAGLGMSFRAARNALTNMPKPE